MTNGRYVEGGVACAVECECSYCPGKEQDFDNGVDEVVVKFYDGRRARVPLTDVFPLPRDKHAADKRYIRRKEAELVGHGVVAWNDSRHCFQLGTFT